nr:TraX family protein [uncultured Faecalicatena sp.]
METFEGGRYRILNRDVIKYIAMFTMLLNHIATVFIPADTWLFKIFATIGYVTAITMIYFLIEGYHYTHSKKVYITRLLLFAFISEIPYCLAFTQGKIIRFCGFNILFTLCLCFALVWMKENMKSKGLRIFLNIVIILVSIICDWALLAPTITLLFLWAGDSGKKTKAAFLFSTLIFGAFNLLGGLSSLWTENIEYALMSMIGMGLAGICILYFYNGKRMKTGRTFSKWFFYIFYPAHLLILGLIRIALGM